jgi:hypothetical protein
MTYNSIQFGVSGQPVADDIADHVHPNNVLPDSQRHRVNDIALRDGTLSSFNSHSGATTAAPAVNSVQLKASTGLVKVPGTPHEVTPEVLEIMKKTSPELFIEPEAKAAQEAAAALDADKARSEEISREDLNRHPGEIEGYHQHIVGEVSAQNLIGLMVAGQKGEAPSEALLHRIAQEMGEPLGSAIDKVNLVSQGVQAQFTALARSLGLDADKAADWIKDHRKDTAMAAAQAHFMRRDMMAWKPLLADYQAATGDGRKRG